MVTSLTFSDSVITDPPTTQSPETTPRIDIPATTMTRNVLLLILIKYIHPIYIY